MSKRWVVVMSAMAQLACCIARGAKVKTPRGERRIEELAVGDEVVVVDPHTREQHVGRISEVRRAMRECSSVNSLRLTSAHPLFDPEKNEWAPAGDWILGARTMLVGIDGPVKATTTERFVGVDEVFDLSIDHPLHTYVVDGVVVHNKMPITSNSCRFSDGARAEAGTACTCADQSGTIMCGEDGFAACTCDAARERWSARGSDDEELRDFDRWEVISCDGANHGLSVEPLSSLTEAYVLEIQSTNYLCGYLRSTTDEVKTPISLRFERGSRRNVTLAGIALDTTTPLVLVGATDIDGGVQLEVSGLYANKPVRFVSSDTLAYDRWYRLDWSLSWEGDFATVSPGVIDLVTQQPAARLESFQRSDAGTSLADWYATGGNFWVRTSNSRRVMLGSPFSNGIGTTHVK